MIIKTARRDVCLDKLDNRAVSTGVRAQWAPAFDKLTARGLSLSKATPKSHGEPGTLTMIIRRAGMG